MTLYFYNMLRVFNFIQDGLANYGHFNCNYIICAMPKWIP